MASYTPTDISKTEVHEMRLTFYDFAQRGVGERKPISTAIEHWRATGGLGSAEADRWQAALEWRELGGLLPGWKLPKEMTGLRGEPDDTDLAAFEAWRARRSEARAA